MNIKFISHASVLIEAEDCVILTDPWYKGTAFNDAWKLFPEPVWDESLFDLADYLWISHEHPDHFSIATLKAMPQSFKERVTVLFQKNNTDKMPDALKKFGFKNIKLLKNRAVYAITPKTKVYVSQIGEMDSSLAVISEGCTLLNVNDCEANKVDCKNFRKDLGKIDILLNQFSMAGYNGYFDYESRLPVIAKGILKNMADNHRDTDAGITIAFASNIYFCTEDNKYMNDFGNTPTDVHEHFLGEKLALVTLYPGDAFDTMHPELHHNEDDLRKYEELYANTAKVIDTPQLVDLGKIEAALKKRCIQLSEKFPKWILKKLRPVRVRIPDINNVVELCLYTGNFKVLGPDADYNLSIYSQPLFYCFETTWGIQTMGVGARFRIKSNMAIWKWYRIITSLNNAEMYLKFKYLFTIGNFNFVRDRMKGGVNQLFYQLRRME